MDELDCQQGTAVSLLYNCTDYVIISITLILLLLLLLLPGLFTPVSGLLP